MNGRNKSARSPYKYSRILLKLSGEAVRGKDSIIDFDLLDGIAERLVKLTSDGVETAVIFGAGNIWRGRNSGDGDRVTADRMGMLATVINCLAAKDSVIRKGGKATVFTSTPMMPYAEYYSTDRALSALSAGNVIGANIIDLCGRFRMSLLLDGYRRDPQGRRDRRRCLSARQKHRRDL